MVMVILTDDLIMWSASKMPPYTLTVAGENPRRLTKNDPRMYLSNFQLVVNHLVILSK